LTSRLVDPVAYVAARRCVIAIRPPSRRRIPVDSRRLLIIGPQPVDELVQLALEDGIGTFI